jgi:glucoside 3-dehydrogenase (cytochrome c) hitch-hiker subunit
MNRREALIRVAGLMGGTLSASTLLAIGKIAAPGESPSTTPPMLSTSQAAIVSGVSDIMIPRTNTPGALDVGVPAFIDLMLRDVYAPEDRDRYLTGLAEFDAAASSGHGKAFAALESTQRAVLVRKFHDAAVHEERQLREAHAHLQRPFILMTKELALLRFFTSRVGATEVLQYVAVPGSFHGCLPLAQAGNGKTWAVAPGIEF